MLPIGGTCAVCAFIREMGAETLEEAQAKYQATHPEPIAPDVDLSGVSEAFKLGVAMKAARMRVGDPQYAGFADKVFADAYKDLLPANHCQCETCREIWAKQTR